MQLRLAWNSLCGLGWLWTCLSLSNGGITGIVPPQLARHTILRTTDRAKLVAAFYLFPDWGSPLEWYSAYTQVWVQSLDINNSGVVVAVKLQRSLIDPHNISHTLKPEYLLCQPWGETYVYMNLGHCLICVSGGGIFGLDNSHMRSSQILWLACWERSMWSTYLPVLLVLKCSSWNQAVNKTPTFGPSRHSLSLFLDRWRSAHLCLWPCSGEVSHWRVRLPWVWVPKSQWPLHLRGLHEWVRSCWCPFYLFNFNIQWNRITHTIHTCIHIHVCTHAQALHIYIHNHMYTHIYTHTHMPHTHMCTPIHIHTQYTYLCTKHTQHMCTHIHTHTYTYTCINTLYTLSHNTQPVHTCTHIHMLYTLSHNTCTHIHMHTCTHTYMHAHIRTPAKESSQISVSSEKS
jgi:hypothetical protein